MGLYDTVRSGDKEGQVKCWGEQFRGISIGDSVPNIDNEYSYLVAMREGGFLVVYKNTLIAWEDSIPEESKNWPLFDKWGSQLYADALNRPVHGLSGHERYFYK